MSKKDFLDSIVSNYILILFVPDQQVRQFIACQFALESDFGSSKLAKFNHNYCGMKFPNRRINYSIGLYNGFSNYYDLDYCIIDYIAWLLYCRPDSRVLSCVDIFKDFLRLSKYCPEKDYISRIESIYNQYFYSKN